jgi:hypothetical protein
MMSAVRPYAVGSTVKWRLGGTEYAGIIVSVHVDPELTGSFPREANDQVKASEPVYAIALSDHSVVTRFHRDLVLV